MPHRDPELPFPATVPAGDGGGLSARRWAALAATAGVPADAPILLALSGGADSVYLLHALARARPGPRLHALHLDHGLRGSASAADAEFCRALCRDLGVPLDVERLEIAPGMADLERRARVARYRALARAAERLGFDWIATGHHADDSLETLLLRWTRGTELAGFAGVPARTVLRPASESAESLNPTSRVLNVVRPLFGLRRAEVREALRSAGLAWREDASNASHAFARNRVRHVLLPALEAAAGEAALEHLAQFAAAVEDFERECALATATIAWGRPRHAAARRAGGDWERGGSLPRADLARLPAPLLRRVLARLLLEGTGRRVRRVHVDRLAQALRSGRTTAEELHSGWRAHLGPAWLHLDPPHVAAHTPLLTPPHALPARQLELPFAPGAAHVPPVVHRGWRLDLPGKVVLPDGRVVLGERVHVPPGSAFPRAPECVELDAEGLAGPLEVRWPWPGGRFHPLGGPGSRPVGRFLRDAGVPRADRSRVPLVCLGSEVLWVAGLRPAEPRRLRAGTAERVRLRLEPQPG